MTITSGDFNVKLHFIFLFKIIVDMFIKSYCFCMIELFFSPFNSLILSNSSYTMLTHNFARQCPSEDFQRKQTLNIMTIVILCQLNYSHIHVNPKYSSIFKNR